MAEWYPVAANCGRKHCPLDTEFLLISNNGTEFGTSCTFHRVDMMEYIDDQEKKVA